jgi:protein O-mannosyl-transferase
MLRFGLTPQDTVVHNAGGMIRATAWILLLPALVACVYGFSIHAGFAYDDRIHILGNDAVTSFRSILDPNSIQKIREHAFGLSARPLLFVTYGMNYASAGADPAAFRWTNLLIHGVNVFLVFWIVLEAAACGSLPAANRNRVALLAAALFAVHPLLTESVTYIAGRSSSLCATFYFAGLVAILRAGRSAGAKRIGLIVVTLACTGIGWLVKQDAVTLPLAAIALIWLMWPVTVPTRSRLYATFVFAAFLLSLFLMLSRSIAAVQTTSQQNQELVGAGFDQALPLKEYVLSSISALTSYYLPRMILPIRLSVDPAVPVIRSPLEMRFALSALVLIGLAAAVPWIWSRDGLSATGITLILVSPLGAYCVFPLADVVAEHRAYITVLGTVMVLAAAIMKLPRPEVLAGVAVLGYSWMTIDRNTVWRDESALWKDAALKAPDSIRPHLNLGAIDQLSGRTDEAIQEYEWVLHRNPQHPAALSNLASLYLAQNDLSRTEDLLNRAIAAQTSFPAVYLNLAVVRMRQGRYDEARILLEKSLSLNPHQWMVHHNLGDILYNEGNPEGAVEEYLRELGINPDSAITQEHLAEARAAAERLRGKQNGAK